MAKSIDRKDLEKKHDELSVWWETPLPQWKEHLLKLFGPVELPILFVNEKGTIEATNKIAHHTAHKASQPLVGQAFCEIYLSHSTPNPFELEALLQKHNSEPPSAAKGVTKLGWRSLRLLTQQGAQLGWLLFATLNRDPYHLSERFSRSLQDLEDEKQALDKAAIIAITDAKGTITYANKKFCDLSKYTTSELIGQNHRIINSGFHSQFFFRNMWKQISQGHIWKGEIRNRAKDGSLYWVDTTIVPFLDDQNRPYRYVSIRTDITDKKQIQREVDEQRSRAVYSERLASLGEMAAAIAHELGSPLATIRGRMELLEHQLSRGPVDADHLLKITHTVKDQADRMTSIIRGILSSARDGSKDPFRAENLRKVLESVLHYSTERLRKHGIDLDYEKVDPALEVTCRETQIAQVFLNLITNACDSIRNLPTRWIRIEATQLENMANISVTDSGPPIAPEIAERLMTPFFSTKGVGKGTGLGLSISHSIIENHQGHLKLDCSANHPRFVFTLPIAQPA